LRYEQSIKGYEIVSIDEQERVMAEEAAPRSSPIVRAEGLPKLQQLFLGTARQQR
jgi:hypothetical protein